MNLINVLVKDIIPFAAHKNLDLHFITRLIDYRLSSVSVDINSDIEVETYISNMRILNSLFTLLGLGTNYTDKQRKAYDNNLLIEILDNPSRLEGYQKFKMSIINEHCKDELLLYEEYINDAS